MRICSPQIGIDPAANLGGAVYDRELLSSMVALGAVVDVLLPKGEAADPGIGWHLTSVPRHRRSYYEYNWIFFRALRRHWKTTPAEILRVHSPYSVGLGALAFARSAGVPTALHYLHREPRRLWVLADRLTLGHYDLIVTISDSTRQELQRFYDVPGDRIVVAYPGVHPRYTPGRAPADGAGLKALYVGGLLRRKNLATALRAVAAVRARGRDLEFDIVGVGPEESTLRAEATRLGLSRYVRFHSRVDEDTKLKFYQGADLFLFPSLREGFGMAAAEALACGTPVIASRKTSLSEIVLDGESGFLLAHPEDPSELAAAIDRLASDHALRAAFAAAGARDVRRRFSWGSTAASVLDAYREAAARRRSTS
jgi:glycosyltransferase involved in cell wall biosynthesis